MSKSTTAKAEQTFWNIIKDRVGNPFILSAIIAFVLNYKVDLYQLRYADSFEKGKDIIGRLTPWSCEFFKELCIVLGLYYVAVLFGESVTWLKHQLISWFQRCVQKKTFLDRVSQSNLINKINRLKRDIDTLTKEKNELQSDLNNHSQIFLKLLNVTPHETVKLGFFKIPKNPCDCQPFVYDTQKKCVSELRPFDKLESYDRIIFKIYESGNSENTWLFLQIGHPFQENIKVDLGNQNLFDFMNNIAPCGMSEIRWHDGQTIFVDQLNPHWKVLGDEKLARYIKLIKSNGKVTLSAKFS